ncbi:MAG: hypothetical protein M1460_03935 [Candidatus Thermoplasmatota archaeon]|jgi:hypothetical protein|nr:hypothetical protein [Candidatus Thermoplasmatota archaeon]
MTTAGIEGLIQTFFTYLIQNPFNDLRFLVPLSLVFAYGLVLRHNSSKSKIDFNPNLSQSKEPFSIPDDYLNKEMLYVTKLDVDHVVNMMYKSSKEIKNLTHYISSNRSRYSRIKYRLGYTQSNRRKETLEKRMEECARNILNAYGTLRKIIMDIEMESKEV